MKLHPPGLSRVGAQRHREVLAKCAALAEDWESGLRFNQRKVMAGQGDQAVGRLLCQGQQVRRKTCYFSGSPTNKSARGV